MDNKIGERKVLPWCEGRQREREKASLLRCTFNLDLKKSIVEVGVKEV